jgi:hypothetical protein
MTDAERDVRSRMEEFIKHVADARVTTTGNAESLEMRDAFAAAIGSNGMLHADKLMSVPLQADRIAGLSVHADPHLVFHADPHLVHLHADELISIT